MVRSFLLNQASRDEGEELDHFALGRDVLCAAGRGKRATEGAARDRHADGGVHESTVKEQRRNSRYCNGDPCTWCTMGCEERRESGRGPP
jgi:hypothetical protein